MFTKNWYKIMADAMMTTEKEKELESGAVDYSGRTRNLYYRDANNIVSALNLRNMVRFVITTDIVKASYGVCFGDGTTPATMDDYNLSGNMITTIVTNDAPTVTVDDEGATLSVVYTVTNTGSEDITISEVCMFNYWYYNSSSYTCYLLERTLLDSPVTIPAGGVGLVTYTIRMNYPT